MRSEELLILLLVAGAVLSLPFAALVMAVMAFVKTRTLREVTGRLDRLENSLRDVADGRVIPPRQTAAVAETVLNADFRSPI